MNASLALSPTSPDLCRRLQTPRSSFQFQPSPSFHGKRRIRINVRGLQFETFQATLDQFPETMLGCPMRRFQFYDPVKDQYYLDRDPVAFDFILFFYQSNGILSRPETISKNAFNEELRFFGMTDHSEEDDYESDSPTATENEYREDDASPTCLQRERKLRKNCWVVMEHPRLSLGANIWGRISLMVILLSVIAFCLETLPELNCSKQDTDSSANQRAQSRNTSQSRTGSNKTLSADPETCHATRIWFIIETTVVVFFLLEYLARLYSSPNRWAFAVSILGIVDLTAIAPYFVTLGVYGGKTQMYQQVTSFSVLRIIRLLRVLRVLKLSRYSYGLKIVGQTFSHTWRILSSLMVCVFMTVVVSSSLLFYAENTDSIPAYFYWAFVTMTTVGYGDVVPTTVLGKLGASCCMFFGIILLFVLPLPVFVTHFSRLYEAKVETTRQGRRRKPALSSPMILDQIMAPPVLKK